MKKEKKRSAGTIYGMLYDGMCENWNISLQILYFCAYPLY